MLVAVVGVVLVLGFGYAANAIQELDPPGTPVVQPLCIRECDLSLGTANMQRGRLTGSMLQYVSAILILIAAPAPLAADDCKIVDSQKTERVEGTILSDGGIAPIARYQCANIKIRNNTGGDKLPGDIVVRVTFTDANFDAKRIDGDRKRIGQGETYRRVVCFQGNFPIEDIQCEFTKR